MTDDRPNRADPTAADPAPVDSASADPEALTEAGPQQGSRRWPREIGGAPGPEPTRYGDWEHNGRCSDF